MQMFVVFPWKWERWEMNMMEGCRACMFVGCTSEEGTVVN